jgi:hypothetical protein
MTTPRAGTTAPLPRPPAEEETLSRLRARSRQDHDLWTSQELTPSTWCAGSMRRAGSCRRDGSTARL